MPAGPVLMPAGCGFADFGCYIKEGAKSVVGEIVGAFADGCIEILKYVATFWMDVPSPQIATGSGNSWQVAASVSELQGYLAPVTASLAVLSFVIAIMKIAITYDAGTGMRNIGRQMAVVTAATLAVEGGMQLLIAGGDAFSPWIIEKASGHSASDGVKEMLLAMFGTGNVSTALGAFLIIFILTLLSSLAQAVFMVIRGAVLMVLAAFVPTAAAGTATDEGWMRFKRIAMWMVGFTLYKPIAAIIFAMGIKLTQANTKGAGADKEPTLQNAIYGFTILTLAAVALPAFIKLLDQTAAIGSSNAFSGGAAAATAATGAAMVALGGGPAAATSGGGASAGGGGIGGGGIGGGGAGGGAGGGGSLGGEAPGASTPGGGGGSATSGPGSSGSGGGGSEDAAPGASSGGVLGSSSDDSGGGESSGGVVPGGESEASSGSESVGAGSSPAGGGAGSESGSGGGTTTTGSSGTGSSGASGGAGGSTASTGGGSSPSQDSGAQAPPASSSASGGGGAASVGSSSSGSGQTRSVQPPSGPGSSGGGAAPGSGSGATRVAGSRPVTQVAGHVVDKAREGSETVLGDEDAGSGAQQA